MTNPLGLTGQSANRFNLNINPSYGQKQISGQKQSVDLRDRYSVEANAKRMGFNNMSEYQQFMWESSMAQKAVQQAADKQATSNILSGIGTIAKGISGIFSLF